jgi:hypothetical protein
VLVEVELAELDSFCQARIEVDAVSGCWVWTGWVGAR